MKQTFPGKQLDLIIDTSFRSAGYALIIEGNPDQKIQSKRKTYAPVAFGSKIFSPAELNMSIYSKEFLAIYMAFLEFAHILWETTKPTIEQFFQTKAIPPALWNSCNYVLQFNSKIVLNVGSINTAVDFLCRLELKNTQKSRPKIRKDIQTTPFEVYNTFSGCCWWRTGYLHPHRQWRWVRRTNPPTEWTFLPKCNGMGSRHGTIQIDY